MLESPLCLRPPPRCARGEIFRSVIPNPTPHLLYTAPHARLQPAPLATHHHRRRPLRSRRDETANLLHNVFSLLPTRQDVSDIVDTANAKLENRLIKFMVAISAINLTALAICTTLIITLG